MITRHLLGLTPLIARGAALAAAISLGACAPEIEPGRSIEVAAGRSASEQRAGDQAYQAILAEYGGAYTEGAVDEYVQEVGRRLAAQTGQAGLPWTFTVLDSPEINAFATPGGYVYVTRGLVALADDEAELAGVIGHEIGHVVAEHSGNRQTRAGVAQIGTVAATLGAALLGAGGQSLGLIQQAAGALGQGYVASYSREQELEADLLGVRYLAGAGFDPMAQADFLNSMRAQSELAATIEGARYDPNSVSFFATHPANADRVRQAVRAAELQTGAGDVRDAGRHLAAIEGMIYGDSPSQGYVRDRAFLHPEFRIAWEAPQGFVIRNSAQQVTATGPGGSALVFDAASDPGVELDRYLAQGWAADLAGRGAADRLQGLRRLTIGGREAAQATLPVQTNAGDRVAVLTAIRGGGGRIWRFLGLAPRGRTDIAQAVAAAALSFRTLTPAQAAALRPLRVSVVTVRPGDTVESLARRMAFNVYAEERFRVLNDLAPGENLTPGQRVKLVVEG